MATAARAADETPEYVGFVDEGGTVCVFKDGLAVLVDDRTLTRTHYRLMLALICAVERGNRVYGSVASVCRRFRINYASGLRTWHNLEERDWVRPCITDCGQTVYWQVKPLFAWKGRPWKVGVVRRNWAAAGQLTRLARQAEEA